MQALYIGVHNNRHWSLSILAF